MAEGIGSGRLARNILSNWGAFGFSAVVNFALSPFLVRSLGDTAYGAWVLLVSMVGYLGLLDLGVRSAVTRYVARFHAAAQHDKAGRLYSAALMIFTIAGVVAILLSCVMALLLGRVFRVPPEFLRVGRMVAVLGGLNIAVSLIGGVFGGILTGLERFDYTNAVEIAVGALRAVAIVVTLRAGLGLVELALVQLAASMIRGGANMYLAHRLYPQLPLMRGVLEKEYVRLIFSFGLSASFLHITSSLMLYSDSLVIGAFLPVGMITYFAIAGNLTEYARTIVSGISQTLTPRISALQTQSDQTVLSTAFLTSARLSTLAVLPIVATFMLRGSSFIALWMGPVYADLAGRVLDVLSVTLWLVAGTQVVASAMFGIGKHAGLIPVYVAEAVCNIGLSILWVRQYGVIGSALGTLVPRVIVSVFVGPWYAQRHLGVPMRTYWLRAFVEPTIGMLPFAASSWAIERFWPATHLAMYFGQVLITLPLAALGVWYLCFSAQERATWRHFIRSALKLPDRGAAPPVPVSGSPAPRVVIGLPVYNGSRFIRTSLDSLLGQTFADFELIICDNASSDETAVICREYAGRDRRVRYVRNPENIGGPRNFNRAFELSRSEYFKWSTADDFWGPRMLEQAVAVLDAHPDVVLAYPKTVLCDQSGHVVEDYEDRLHLMQPRAMDRFIQLVSTIGLSHQHLGLIRADALRRTALLGDHVASDINLLAELTLHGKFFEIPERSFFRRFHPDSSSWDREDINRQMAYYDPQRTIGLRAHKLHGFQAFLKAVARAPLGFGDKLRLHRYVLQMIYWKRAELFGGKPAKT